MMIATLLMAVACTAWTTNTAEKQPGSVATGFVDKVARVGDESYRYSVYVPPDYAAGTAWPVVLFLHGSGERGTDGLLQTEVGIGTAIRRSRQRFPALVVLPQCRPGDVWWSPAMTALVQRCLNDTVSGYNIDRERIYLTGLSLGGGGCWHFAAAAPELFAAVVPLCALDDKQMGYKTPLAPRLTRTAIWAFHGSADRNVPVSATRNMVAAIRAAGGNAFYSELPGVGHNIWNQVYARHGLWEWLFKQRRGKVGGAPADVDAAR